MRVVNDGDKEVHLHELVTNCTWLHIIYDLL